MGGSSVSDGWEFTAGGNRTVVLVGRTGDGKSSTGNSILGRKEFRSMPKSSGVTSTCELKSTRLPDGTVLDVIDTPGLFDFSADQVTVGNEIVKCVDLAKDGIHAVLLVLSVRSRFSREEQAAVQSFLDFFGNRITDYMILVFTGGDDLEETDVTFEDYLGTDCPELEVESQLKVSMQRLEEQLAEERASRLEAEKDAKEAQKNSDDKNRELKDRLESSRREIEELRNRCIIL